MRRTVAAVALAGLLCGCAGDSELEAVPTSTPSPTETVLPSVSPAPPPSPSPTNSERAWPVGKFHTELAVEVVEHLATVIGPRSAGSDADRATRAYVADRFRAAGWTVQSEAFELPQGGVSENVIATRPGFSLDAPHRVVGAHHDTVDGSPGANDNATGIGALVALAYALGTETDVTGDPVVLVAFGAEEFQPAEPRVHHLGSQDYVDRRGGAVTAMVSIDMIGHAHPPVHCLCYLRDTADTQARTLATSAETAGLGGAFRVEARGDISDHGPFALAGIPAAFVWSYDDGVKHTAGDVVEPLHAEDIGRVGQLVLSWLTTSPES